MMVHYRKDENGNIILSEYMFNRLMKLAHNKEKENKELKKEIERLNNIINEFEKILKEEKTRTRYANDVERFTAYDYMLKRLQELKEVISNE